MVPRVTYGGGLTSGGLGSELLTRGLTTSGLASGLLSAGHFLEDEMRVVEVERRVKVGRVDVRG